MNHSSILAYFRFELSLQGRMIQETLGIFTFFLLILFCIPFSFSPDPLFQSKLQGGLLVFSILLINVLTLPRLFRDEQSDGFLEIILLSPNLSTEMILGVKLLIHFLTIGIPSLCIPLIFLILQDVPWIVVLYGLSGFILLILAISFLGVTLSTATLKSQNNFVLLGILTFPVLVPLLILGGQAYHELLLTFEPPIEIGLGLLGLCLLYGPMAIVFGSFSLKESIKMEIDIDDAFDTDLGD